jgi:hypothetical protein
MKATKSKTKRGARSKRMPPKPSLHNTDVFRSQVTAYVVDSNTTTAGSQGFAFFLNYPNYYRNPAGTILTCAQVSTNLANEMKMFDEYKVLSLTLRYLPWVNSVSYAAATVPLDPVMFIVTDNDDSALLTTQGKALNGQGTSVFSVVDNAGKEIRVTQYNEGSHAKGKWGNSQSPSPAALDSVNPLELASIKVYVNAYAAANSIKGTFLLQWDVLFRGIYGAQ